MGYFLMLLVGVALLTSMVWRPAPPPAFHGVTTQDVPRVVNGYAAPTDYQMPPEVIAMLPNSDIISRQYNKGRDVVDFVLLGGSSREALHDPRSCLVGAGWSLANDHTERLPQTSVDLHACRIVGLSGTTGFDVLYLYVVDGRRASSIAEIRREMLWSALIGRKNEPVYMLRFMQPLSSDPDMQSADHARLMNFASQMWTNLQPKIEKH